MLIFFECLALNSRFIEALEISEFLHFLAFLVLLLLKREEDTVLWRQ